MSCESGVLVPKETTIRFLNKIIYHLQQQQHSKYSQLKSNWEGKADQSDSSPTQQLLLLMRLRPVKYNYNSVSSDRFYAIPERKFPKYFTI